MNPVSEEGPYFNIRPKGVSFAFPRVHPTYHLTVQPNPKRGPAPDAQTHLTTPESAARAPPSFESRELHALFRCYQYTSGSTFADTHYCGTNLSVTNAEK